MIRIPGGRINSGEDIQEHRRVFLTFADSKMVRSAQRLAKQAERLKFYDDIVTADERDLDPAFVFSLRERLTSGSRGYGYWSWKPQIVLQILAGMADGDVLQYTDAGCHLNERGRRRLVEYFNMACRSENGVLAFQANPPEDAFEYDGRGLLDLREFRWSKGDLFEYFSVYENKEITHSQQIGGGVFFVCKSAESEKIFSDWRSVFFDRFSLADDSVSVKPNLDGFVEHRHDQSIFSVLCKLNRVKTVSAYEYWYPKRDSMRPDWNALKKYPIHAKRDLDFGSIKNMQRTAARFWALVWHVMKRLRDLK